MLNSQIYSGDGDIFLNTSSGAVYSEGLINNFVIANSTSEEIIPPPFVTITEYIRISLEDKSGKIFNITSLNEIITSSLLKITEDISILENYILDSNLLEDLFILKNIVEELLFQDNSHISIIVFEYILDEYLLYSMLFFNNPESITEIILFNSIHSTFVNAFGYVIDSILINDNTNLLLNLNIISKENITLLDNPSPSSLYNILSSSEIQLIIGQQDSDKYISYLLEPETFSTSTYSNYNFSQSTKFNNKYIFSNKEGLYEYGSEYDDGEIITARIQTAALDFGTSNLKQMPYFYIGVTNSNKLVLKLSVDGKASVYYKLNKKTDYLSNQKISIGKGLIGRYFQFELITEENTDFNMESIEFTPLVLRRKL